MQELHLKKKINPGSWNKRQNKWIKSYWITSVKLARSSVKVRELVKMNHKGFLLFLLFCYILWVCAVTLPFRPRAGGGLVITDLAECRSTPGDDICVFWALWDPGIVCRTSVLLHQFQCLLTFSKQSFRFTNILFFARYVWPFFVCLAMNRWVTETISLHKIHLHCPSRGE